MKENNVNSVNNQNNHTMITNKQERTTNFSFAFLYCSLSSIFIFNYCMTTMNIIP